MIKMTHLKVLLFVVSIRVIFADDECSTLQYCTALSWRAWGNCEGNCGKQTLQTRKRTICYDSDEIYLRISMPITRQKVLNFCNITQPTVETRLCKQCIFGKFNVTANACEICSKLKLCLIYLCVFNGASLALQSCLFLMRILLLLFLFVLFFLQGKMQKQLPNLRYMYCIYQS